MEEEAAAAMLPSGGNGVFESSLLKASAYEPSLAPPPPPSDCLPPPISPGQAASTANASVGTKLPEDVLADILRCLPPRGLAVSRSVCRAWRAAVDGRRLLRADLLPLSVRGLVLRYRGLDYPAFLSRPSTGPDTDILAGARSDSSHHWYSYVTVVDHCNGLLLLKDPCGLIVSNPATRRWAHLPPPPRFGWLLPVVGRLVFDPADSPHYEVFLVPLSRRIEERDMKLRHQQVREDMGSQEWPPSTWFLCVFSSLTGKWEERSFAREGEPPEMASDKYFTYWDICGAYWRGALYWKCYSGSSSSLIRISLSNYKHQVIKVPTDIGLKECSHACVGRSEKEVFCSSIHNRYTFRVWILDESCGQIKWVLNHHIDLQHTVSLVMTYHDQGIEGPWMLQDSNNSEDYGEEISDDEDGNSTALIEQKFDWDSDVMIFSTMNVKLEAEDMLLVLDFILTNP